MSTKGRHSDGGPGSFYRDLALMILGILLVGAAVFFVLYLLADGPSDSTTTSAAATGSSTTSTEAATTSSAGATSSTSSTSTSSSTTSTMVPVRPPAEVRVVVLNSMGLAGAAGRMTEQLEEAGYQTLPATDYSPEQDPSRIWYREGFSAEASELLQFIDGAVVEPLADESLQPGADLIMILGTGYDE